METQIEMESEYAIPEKVENLSRFERFKIFISATNNRKVV